MGCSCPQNPARLGQQSGQASHDARVGDNGGHNGFVHSLGYSRITVAKGPGGIVAVENGQLRLRPADARCFLQDPQRFRYVADQGVGDDGVESGVRKIQLVRVTYLKGYVLRNAFLGGEAAGRFHQGGAVIHTYYPPGKAGQGGETPYLDARAATQDQYLSRGRQSQLLEIGIQPTAKGSVLSAKFQALNDAAQAGITHLVDPAI
jgi:hypothetical protein